LDKVCDACYDHAVSGVYISREGGTMEKVKPRMLTVFFCLMAANGFSMATLEVLNNTDAGIGLSTSNDPPIKMLNPKETAYLSVQGCGKVCDVGGLGYIKSVPSGSGTYRLFFVPNSGAAGELQVGIYTSGCSNYHAIIEKNARNLQITSTNMFRPKEGCDQEEDWFSCEDGELTPLLFQ
jgi:hypothetical protein